MFKVTLLPFFPTTESGDVSSIRDVDMLELLRVVSSCNQDDCTCSVRRYRWLQNYTENHITKQNTVQFTHKILTKSLLKYDGE